MMESTKYEVDAIELRWKCPQCDNNNQETVHEPGCDGGMESYTCTECGHDVYFRWQTQMEKA